MIASFAISSESTEMQNAISAAAGRSWYFSRVRNRSTEIRAARTSMQKAFLLSGAAFDRAPVLFLLRLIAAGHLPAECFSSGERFLGITAQKNEWEESVCLPVFRLVIRKARQPLTRLLPQLSISGQSTY